MIKTIAHLADIHIRKVPTRNDEYSKVFKTLIKSLKKQKPDRIVIDGDLFHDYLDLQGEQLILASELLNDLGKIAPVRAIRGNHDFRKKNTKRVDSVAAIVKIMNNPNIIYYNKTGFFSDDNVMWAVWHHGQPKNNPWKTREAKTIDFNGFTTIDLFHDPINGCKSTTGFEMKRNSYYSIKDFEGDYSLLGDIHKMQYFSYKTKAYCGSLIAQDFSEGDDHFHGYLLWDILKGNIKEVSVHNDYSFKNVKLTPFTDFDDLETEIDNPTKYMKVRIVWSTLPSTRNKENERKLINYLNGYVFKEKIVSFSHKNEFVVDDTIEIEEDVTINNITDQEVQHEIFEKYLDKIGVEDKMIADILNLDSEITAKIDIDPNTNIEWSVEKFGGKNFMSYANIDIDWRGKDGLYQITGENTAGKTTILKLISYILFAKTLETETRMKYGDYRFVNNKTDDDTCEAYLVLEANGEYYGIKRNTTITRNKKGEMNGAPTKVGYYLLGSPDDKMTDENSLDNLTEDDKNKTQKRIDEIIGSYDNYMRVVMTTSDTLNRILSNDMAVFIDSLLFDSGLDIFDRKLTGIKEHKKELNKKSRITCNIETTENENKTLDENIELLNNEINVIKENKLPDVRERIKKGGEYVEELTKKLFKIDPEIANLDVETTNETIKGHENEIIEFDKRKVVLDEAIKPLKKTYDHEKLDELIEKKDDHKTNEYNKKLEIKEEERKINNWTHEIEIINGKIHVLKQNGTKKKEEIIKLKESKTCPTCGQPLLENHRHVIDENIKKLEVEMFGFADEINKHQTSIVDGQNVTIESAKKVIDAINIEIEKANLLMEKVLIEIGELTNDKNDVEKRKEHQSELDQIPVKKQNEELKKSILKQKLESYNNSLIQIKENIKINRGIDAAKEKLVTLNTEEDNYNEIVTLKSSMIISHENKKTQNLQLIKEFEEQEYQDSVIETYLKCVHREGIPRQLLSNYVIPKVNVELENVLSIAPFKVWLDVNDLRPKLAYYNTPNAVIDAISSSGKERTFASVVLKTALNEINVKSKPKILLLDEIMGKLSNESVEEFVQILQIIKQKCTKFLIIEHIHEVDPDYIISVSRTDSGISSATIV